MRYIPAGILLILCFVAALAQTANTPFVTITGSNANYPGGTIVSTLIRPGRPNATGTTVVLTGTGQFSMVSWNNLDSHNAPSTTTFTLVTADGNTSYTTPQLTIAHSMDISQQLMLAPIPQQ